VTLDGRLFLQVREQSYDSHRSQVINDLLPHGAAN
jgi:hypothetical protein